MAEDAPPRHAGEYAKAGAVGFGVNFGCLLVPPVHPLGALVGPFVGGFIAGSRFRATGSQATLIGLIMGSAFGVLLGIPSLVVLFSPLASAVGVASGTRTVIAIGIVFVICYVGLVGAIGAAVGGNHAARSAADPPPPGSGA